LFSFKFFWNLYFVKTWKQEKEKKRYSKEKEKKNIVKVCVCLYFVYECFFNDKIARIKKNLIF